MQKKIELSVLSCKRSATMIRLIIAVLVFTIHCKQSSASGTLDCFFEMYQFDTIGSVYTCTGHISFNEESAEVTQMVSDRGHMSGKVNADVQALRIYYRGMNVFPVNIENFFSNIKVLHFGENLISNITNRHLSPFTELKFLSLWNNRLTSLDTNLFSGLESLHYINFEFNRIMHVGHDLILPNSGEIRFYGNLCISETASTPDAISHLKFLLSVRCPPTISHIEDILKGRGNLLTNVNGQVQRLERRSLLFEEKISLMALRIASLEAIIEGLGWDIEGGKTSTVNGN